MIDSELALEVRSLLAALPAAERLPSLTKTFERTTSAAHPDWQIPVLIGRAGGGCQQAAVVAAAAIACLQISIMIADDILDQDPRGAHQELGVGPATNLALAFQAAAVSLIDRPCLDRRLQAPAALLLSRAALATAAGQQLDVTAELSEENYWRIVSAKSTPFYGAAHQLGAVVCDLNEADWPAFYEYGVTIGELIQIEDDLLDALEVPANPDWHNTGNNLLLVYTATAGHPDRREFLNLLASVRIGDQHALARAQEIMLSAGAASYAVHQLIGRFKRARQMLQALPLRDVSELQAILDAYAQRLTSILRLGDSELTFNNF